MSQPVNGQLPSFSIEVNSIGEVRNFNSFCATAQHQLSEKTSNHLLYAAPKDHAGESTVQHHQNLTHPLKLGTLVQHHWYSKQGYPQTHMGITRHPHQEPD